MRHTPLVVISSDFPGHRVPLLLCCIAPVTHSRIIGEGPESAGSRFTPTNQHIWGTFGVCGYTVQEEPRWSYEFPVGLTPNHHQSPPPPPDSTRFNYESAQNVPRTLQECDRGHFNLVCLSRMSSD